VGFGCRLLRSRHGVRPPHVGSLDVKMSCRHLPQGTPGPSSQSFSRNSCA
jgi:hypothetical protein